MLILTRKAGESFVIALGDVDPNTPVGELFARGPIQITVTCVRQHQLRLGIEADTRFLILRSELMGLTRNAGKFSTG